MNHQSLCSPASTGHVESARSAEIMDNLRGSLENRGYSSATIKAYVRSIEHFRRWLQTRGKKLVTASPQEVQAFLTRHLAVCHCPGRPRRNKRGTRAALHHLLALNQESSIEPLTVIKLTPVERELNSFRVYLIDTCGLSEATCMSRCHYAEEFLAQIFKTGEVALRTLEPRRVMEWIALRSRSCKPGTAGVIAACIHSYLRFCQFRGLIDERLLHAVPSVPRWRLVEIPRHLNDEELRRFCGCFDTSTPVGCRDYAMALCMVEMGLRASEVAGLQLKDIDWHYSVLHIRDVKNSRERMLPLPQRPGRAIVRYLRHGRPRTVERSVFVRHRVPHGAAMTPELVRGSMRRAYARAGFPAQWTGTHVLRHTAATRMHQHGVSLKEIADVLGHRCLDTSVIYTKVNLPALRAVGLPWPEATHDD